MKRKQFSEEQIINPYLVERILFVERVGKPGLWMRPAFFESHDYIEAARNVLNHFAQLYSVPFALKDRNGKTEMATLPKGDYSSRLRKNRGRYPLSRWMKRKSAHPRVIIPALSAGFTGICRFEADSGPG